MIDLLRVIGLWLQLGVVGVRSEHAAITAERFATNPLITVKSSETLGGNVNGPSVIRVPAWVRNPLGRYYMYFANHKGRHIRLAYADALEGPWKIYEPGVLQVKETAFYRPQPDPPGNPMYTHVASPEALIDQEHRRIILWAHGNWTDGKPWPAGREAARAWMEQNAYGQYTQAFESTDGLHFFAHPEITRESYLRVFPYDGQYFGMSRLGRLLRAREPFATFEPGPDPFRDTKTLTFRPRKEGINRASREAGPVERVEIKWAGGVRHVAMLVRGDNLHVFFSVIGGAPETILHSSISLGKDWNEWKASWPEWVLLPEASYECPTLPTTPSKAGDAAAPVRQLRDPAVFEENGNLYLFYSTCGEQGIAGARFRINNYH